jgi:cytochrome c biogenesis protein CcdA
MLRVTILAITIGLADSVNPTTIGPALYLAAGRDARRQVMQFTIAVFGVYFLGGFLILVGPGQLLLSLVPHPSRRVSYILEIVAGVALLTAGAFLWTYRAQLMRRKIPEPKTEGKSSAILGATITAVELPTAFPYFAAIAAIVGSGLGLPRQVGLLVLFNICFVVPLIVIVGIVTFAGERATEMLVSARKKLEARWPATLAVIFLVAGVFVTLLGVTGLAGLGHGRFGHFARRVRRLLHLHP